MCGRVILTSSFREKIKAIFAGLTTPQWLVPRYNVSPGQPLPVMKSFHPAQLEWMDWGFHADRPASGEQKSRMMINARAETVNRLPSFRDSFLQYRCIIFADGFYEWHRNIGHVKPQPYFFGLKDESLLAIAGLWTPGNDGENESCVVITTEANSVMHPIHDRMPALFTMESATMWLNPATAPDTLHAMLQPYPSNLMISYPVSDRVNKAANEGPELIAPVTVFEQASLF